MRDADPGKPVSLSFSGNEIATQKSLPSNKKEIQQISLPENKRNMYISLDEYEGGCNNETKSQRERTRRIRGHISSLGTGFRPYGSRGGC